MSLPQDDHGAPPPATDDAADAQGDPACWLERVCDSCGALEDGPPPPVCAGCGGPREP